MTYQVKLDAFEGPLDLLLHLINRLEIDIYDIPMAELTGQYIEHLQAMRVLQLDELSEYLVLAATLIEIKSKMLLPVHEGEVFEDDYNLEVENDPRDELVARLIEYRKYKEAAISLKGSAEERSGHFTKPPEDLTEFGEIVAVETEESMNIFDLIGAFQKMLDRKRLKAPLTASISKTEVSLSEKMDEIMEILERGGGKCAFHSLFEKWETTELVVTFLSLLELMKRRDVIVEQHGNFDEMTVSFRREDE
ncbi:segregation/condensation protein A [Sporosarcina sp. JAI121]|uniref:segregation/condensation protein A n=1 Tax=Sporosarcina sp. JAI121 TaxID=2723064 RepID=UPI0015C6A29E|nr:segregation/condensation protein A [Sporosarcina sp. JAI121]NYF24466.1 segregation and condensation protein A [Sporosarcina sp. JAI121]